MPLGNGVFQTLTAGPTPSCQKDTAWHGWIVSEAIGFTEGDSEEWRWFVPHDLEGLVQLFGSAENYVKVGLFF